MMTSSVVKKANIAGDDVCSLDNLAYNYAPISCVNTVFVHKLKQEGIEIALLVSHWLIFLTNQQTKVLAPNYNPTEWVVSHRSVLVI